MKYQFKFSGGNLLNVCLVAAIFCFGLGCSEIAKGFKKGFQEASNSSPASPTPPAITGSPSSNSYSPEAGKNPSSGGSGGYDKPTLPFDHNGFSRDKSAPLKTTTFPNATDALIANYKTTSGRYVVVEAALYSSSDDARDGLSSHLTAANAQVLERSTVDGTPYAYYKNSVDGTTYYHFCLQTKNQLLDTFAPSMETVKAFLK